MLRDRTAVAPARLPRGASAQLSGDNISSSTGGISGSCSARGALMGVGYGKSASAGGHTHPYTHTSAPRIIPSRVSISRLSVLSRDAHAHIGSKRATDNHTTVGCDNTLH